MGRIAPMVPGPLVFDIDVRQRRQDVQMLRVRQIVQERQNQQHVRPPHHIARAGGRVGRYARQETGEPGGQDAGARLLSGDNREGVQQEQRDHERRDHRQDQQRVPLLELIALQPLRAQHEAAIEQPGHGSEHEQRERLL
jgi:hypothetical protein